MEAKSGRPKVSVCVMTYKQEKYIRQCLQSIVDQVTDFEFEIIVGDDGSPDGTAGIVREFAERYPSVVRPLLHERNIGATANYLTVHNMARGEYVANVDGDDYCLPGKLQCLADYLDANPECRIVWHRMLIINERGQSAVGMPVVPMSRFIPSGKLYARDLAKFYGITGCHSGSMYRASAKKITYGDKEMLDYFFTLSFCADGGYAAYIEEPYGVYRFFSHEKTLTRSEGSVFTGNAKLVLIAEYLKTNPELAKSFAAQCLFDFMLRVYLRYPLKMAYLKMFFRCRAIPSLRDLLLIARVFNSSRNTSLNRAFAAHGEVSRAS